MKRTQWLIVLTALAIGVVGCGDDDRPVDSGMMDAGRDGSMPDGSRPDTGVDGGIEDDASMEDAGPEDGGTEDGGTEDGGTDAGTDAGTEVDGITAVRAATPGTLSPAIAIDDAIVTYVRPMIGSDPAGFFVQSAATGPALFVALDPATLTPVLAAGDTVDFTVTTTNVVSGMLHVTAIESLTRSATGASLMPLVQNVTAATDLVSATDDYESEYVFANVVLAGDDVLGGGGHRSFPVNTTGLTGDANLQLRVPDAFVADLALEAGCEVAVGPAPLWRFANATSNRAQLMGYRESDLVVASCPLPEVVGAVATSPTTVVVSFSRPLDPTTVGAEDFAFTGGAGLTASAVVVSEDGRSVTVTVGPMASGTTYTVTVTGVEDAITGDGIDTAANTAMFEALGAEVNPTVGEVIFTEISYNALGGTETNAEWVELHNTGSVARQLLGCSLTGGGAADTVVFGNVVIPAGGYLVVGGAMSEASPDVTWTGFGLGNSGEALTLTCGAATVIDTVTYAAGGAWPASTDGVSIQLSNTLLNATANDAGPSWCLTAEGTTYGPDTMRRGTPGDPNATCAAAPVAPTVSGAMATAATTVVVTFSEALDPATVAVGDFAFDMGLTASAAVLAGDGLSATITTSAQTAGTTYTVTVTGVSDTMGTAIAGMNTAMFAGFSPGGMGVLIISEYVEGSGTNNKAIEIANIGTTAMSLEGCFIRLFANGAAATPTASLALTGTLAADATFVLCNQATIGGFTCNANSGSVANFNGDDALRLECGGTNLDTFGIVGTDPGTAWTGGGVTTVNQTLRRQCSVMAGNPAGFSDPSLEWEQFPIDTFDGLGAHCP
jgi:hypothetical protein